MKYTAFILSAAFCFGATVTTVSAQTPLKTVAEGEIRFLNNPIYPPMEFVDEKTGEIDGFDPDLAKAVAERLKLKPVFVKAAFSDLQSSLQTGRGDAIISGMSDTVARQDAMDMIDYIVSGPTFFTLKSKAGEITDQTDVCGRTVAASRTGTIPRDVAKWSDENCIAAGKPAVKFEGVADSNAARLGMKQGRYEVVVQGSETLAWLVQLEPDNYSIIGDPILNNDVFAIGFKKDNPELRDAVLNAVNEMIVDGSYGKLLEKWNLKANAIEKATVNGVK